MLSFQAYVTLLKKLEDASKTISNIKNTSMNLSIKSLGLYISKKNYRAIHKYIKRSLIKPNDIQADDALPYTRSNPIKEAAQQIEDHVRKYGNMFMNKEIFQVDKKRSLINNLKSTFYDSNLLSVHKMYNYIRIIYKCKCGKSVVKCPNPITKFFNHDNVSELEINDSIINKENEVIGCNGCSYNGSGPDNTVKYKFTHYIPSSYKIYCKACEMAISTNVYKYHQQSKKHTRSNRHKHYVILGDVKILKKEITRMMKIMKIKSVSDVLASLESLQVFYQRLTTDGESVGKLDGNSMNFVSCNKQLREPKSIHDQLYYCEVCGYETFCFNTFKTHFGYDQHHSVLSKYGIKNFNTFYGVATLDRFQELFNKYKNDDLEEFEDREGNVYDKDTYLDLLRNNLL